MGAIAYGMCAVTSILCFVLLARGYQRSRVSLLFWSSLAFFFFSIQNIIVFLDFVIFPQVILVYWRAGLGLLGAAILVYGLTMEAR